MKNHLKTISIVLMFQLFLTLSAQDKSAVLMKVGNKPVTLEEFENVYRKNNSKDIADKKSLEEYVELFINFKLKVREAESLGMDTSESFRNELSGYRKQLAQPYLTDKDVNENLVRQAYERMQWDIRASHILVKAAEDALPKDTLDAYNKIIRIRDRILKGEDFNVVAKESGISDDPSSAENGGDLGYFTVMQMVYPFESAVYTTKPGDISMPVRTRYGYHIIKVMDKRKAQGEIQVAHIMTKISPNMSGEDSLKSLNKINELYEKLLKGEKFEDLAAQHSDDKASGKDGGKLQWFGTGRMPLEFELASFGLQKNGDFSKPVRTRYGWHIIKRIDKKEIPPFDDIKNELKNKVSKDSRSQIGKASLIAKVKSQYHFRENSKALAEFYKTIDSTFFQARWKADEKAKAMNKVMFTLKDKKYTQADFASFVEKHQVVRKPADEKVIVNALYKQFVEESCLAFEESMLDSKYKDFRVLMQEYRDGILLFNLTDQKVWSKAVKDTTGLKEFYEKNREKYMWEERADATLFSCTDEKAAARVRDMLKRNKSEKEILDEVNKDSQLNLQVENRFFQPKENSLVDANWSPGTSANVKSEKNRVEFVVVRKLIKPEIKSLNEARGLVTSDYQNFLEKQWIDELRLKYPVQVDKNVLATIQ